MNSTRTHTAKRCFSPPDSGATVVEWQPPREEGIRVSRVVRRPLFEVQRRLQAEPSELLRLAYGDNFNANPQIIRFRLFIRAPWLTLPVLVEYRTPKTSTLGAITMSWRAAHLARIFPEMEAHLHAQPHEDSALLVLEGKYRPPFGLVGLLTDRLLGHFIAEATTQQFVERLGSCLEQR